MTHDSASVVREYSAQDVRTMLRGALEEMIKLLPNEGRTKLKNIETDPVNLFSNVVSLLMEIHQVYPEANPKEILSEHSEAIFRICLMPTGSAGREPMLNMLIEAIAKKELEAVT